VIHNLGAVPLEQSRRMSLGVTKVAVKSRTFPSAHSNWNLPL